jgi:hypothetical protein
MRRLVVLAVAPLVVAACGSHSATQSATTTSRHEKIADESAAQFVVRVQAQLKRGQFAQAWQTLHPAERRVVSAQRLGACYPRDEFPGAVTFRARAVRDVRWTVPGTGNTTDAKEITLTATSSAAPKQTFKQHVVRRGSGWAWMLSSAYFRRAKTGSC